MWPGRRDRTALGVADDGVGLGVAAGQVGEGCAKGIVRGRGQKAIGARVRSWAELPAHVKADYWGRLRRELCLDRGRPEQLMGGLSDGSFRPIARLHRQRIVTFDLEGRVPPAVVVGVVIGFGDRPAEDRLVGARGIGGDPHADRPGAWTPCLRIGAEGKDRRQRQHKRGELEGSARSLHGKAWRNAATPILARILLRQWSKRAKH